MKRIALALLILSAAPAFAEEQPQASAPGDFGLSIESGWNSYAGMIGIRGEYRLFSGLAANAGAGIGAWGPRLSAGLRIYPSWPYGLAFGAGIACNTGEQDRYDHKSLTVDPVTGVETKEIVTYRTTQVFVVNLSAVYSWDFSDGDRFYIEAGWGFSLKNNPYEATSASGHPLSRSSKKKMDLIQPGGLILSCGYTFF